MMLFEAVRHHAAFCPPRPVTPEVAGSSPLGPATASLLRSAEDGEFAGSTLRVGPGNKIECLGAAAPMWGFSHVPPHLRRLPAARLTPFARAWLERRRGAFSGSGDRSR